MTDETDRAFLARLRAAHGRISAAEVERGRDAAIDAWRGVQAAEAHQLDRTLDPEAPAGTEPASWAEVSGPLSVTEAAAMLRAMMND